GDRLGRRRHLRAPRRGAPRGPGVGGRGGEHVSLHRADAARGQAVSARGGLPGAPVSLGNRAGAPKPPDAERLEALWSGDFGDAYTARNAAAGEERRRFWRATLDEFPAARVLEVGCNLGANLRWIASGEAAGTICGVDVNLQALERLRRAAPRARPVAATALGLPFADRAF